jgi:predicted Zn finger-like uncharacterized protein
MQCPSCDTQLRVGEDKRGKQIRCPKCQEVFRVPAGPAPGKKRRLDDEDDEAEARFADRPVRPPRSRDDDDEEEIPRRARRSRRDADDRGDDDYEDEPRPRRREKKGSALPWILAGSGAGVLAVVGVVVAVVVASKKSDEPAKNQAVVQAAVAPGGNTPPAAPAHNLPVQNPGNQAVPVQPAPQFPQPNPIPTPAPVQPAVPIVPAAPLDTSGAPPPGWTVFSAKDNSFSVWLPNQQGRRSERTRSMNRRGMRFNLNVVQLAANGGPLYSAATITLSPNAARQIPLQALIEIMRDAFVEDIRGTVTGEQQIQLGDAPGREYTISAGASQARLRAYTRGTRIYHAAILGSPQQIQSVEANTFFSSYKLSGSAVAAKPNAPQPGSNATPQPSPNRPAKPGAAAAIKFNGDVFAFVQAALKENRLAETRTIGFKLHTNRYRHTFDDGGVLIGFEVGHGNRNDNVTVNAFRPIFLTRNGEKLGAWTGPPPASPTVVKAKPGYVVGSMSVRAGLVLFGFSINFVKLGKDAIEVADNYDSDWIGGTRGNPTTIGGRGALVAGVTGHLDDNRLPSSLGLLLVTPKQ